jgi:hypothetical protein
MKWLEDGITSKKRGMDSENLTDKDHIRGAFKAYRKSVLNK